MRFYRATAFLFPRNYERRILLVGLGMAIVPLVACVAFQAITGEWHAPTLIAILVTTLVAAPLGLAAISALLSPIRRAVDSLEAVWGGRPFIEVPYCGDDLVGRLFRGVAAAAEEAASQLESRLGAADRDALTGIRNRSGFLDSAESILLGTGNSVVALVDIDHFKLINERFGHDAGDALLKGLAARLEDSLRRTDIAARWGGEEFAVLFPDTQLDEARLVMERLRASVALDSEFGQEGWPVTFSCGLASLRTFAELGDATHQAEAALRVAKESGRNRVQVARETQA
jgi:diguanylate cyclase (GGDEF)-like protein